MDRLSGDGDDLPVLVDAAAGVSAARRWVADPVPMLLLLGLAGLTGAVLALLGLLDGTAAWLVPALFGVLAAGVALSGST